MSDKILYNHDGSLTPVGFAAASVADIVKNRDNFFVAIANGNERAVQAFIDNEPNCVNWTMDRNKPPYRAFNGGTGMMGAAVFDHPKIADMLLTAGADINAQDKDGNTPLLAAFEQKNVDVSKFLVQNNARFDIPNHAGDVVTDMLGKGEVSQMIRAKMEAAGGADEYGRQDPKTASPKVVQDIATPGDVVIKDVGPGSTIKNITAGGNITISNIGAKPPKR